MGQNPAFYVTPTSGVLELLYSSRHQYSTSLEFKAQDSELMKKGWLGFCKSGLNGFYNNITDKPYIIDKSRGWGVNYDFLNTFIDSPKIICMVRDVRSIYSSMEKNFRKNPEISKQLINWSTGENSTVERRIETWSTTVPVGLAFTRLKEMFNLNIYNNILFIRYEDLTINPKHEINKIYDYLGLPNFTHNFDEIKQITVEDDSLYGPYGDHKIKLKIEPYKTDYNKILGPKLSEQIFNSYEWYNDYFNYNL